MKPTRQETAKAFPNASPTLEEPNVKNELPSDEKATDGEDPLTEHSLLAGVVNQEDLERDVMHQASKAIAQQDKDRDERLLAKGEQQMTDLRLKLKRLKSQILSAKPSEEIALRTRLNQIMAELKEAQNSQRVILERLEQNQEDFERSESQILENERERLIRTGKITPFSHETSAEQETMPTTPQKDSLPDNRPVQTFFPSIVMDELAEDEEEGTSLEEDEVLRPRKRLNAKQKVRPRKRDRKEEMEEENNDDDDDDDDQLVDIEEESHSEEDERAELRKSRNAVQYMDDGDERVYRQRINAWFRQRQAARRHRELENSEDKRPLESESDEEKDDISWDQIVQESRLPSLDGPDAIYDDEYRLPGEVYGRLFEYQRVGVKWLWELHCQGVGGIEADEMGLGKTVQVISYLLGLWYSDRWPGSAVIVCPATLIRQWVQEFHRWWPFFRVVVLHSSGSGMDVYKDPISELVKHVQENGHVLVTTYEGVRVYRDHLLSRSWGHVVLDEGHKIRNPDADITLCCKQFQTSNRIILSGTPIQNNLTELWSLFDFVYPGRLGTLPVFQTQFSVPIRLGGYANANAIQVQTAYKCACILRDLVNPYMLRRMKIDVAQQMPGKNEQVLFCKLTPIQRKVYEDFLQSSEMTSIFEGKRHVLYGIDLLRKICNHPDLLFQDTMRKSHKYGAYNKSGKMTVVRALLTIWHKQKHRVLLFTQTRQMQDILELLIQECGFKYRRMDGTTPVKSRIPLVDEFNRDPHLFIFLLTTRVGGLGINLTGANRVIIYDPDWNPSTDMQARERAWRLGQRREVTIYRLMTSGTIEEKIYHRQIFKQFLTNKILKDPKQRRFFKSNDLYDLFSLSHDQEGANETEELFSDAKYRTPEEKRRDLSKLFGDQVEQEQDDERPTAEGLNLLQRVEEKEMKAEEDEHELEESSKQQQGDETRILKTLFKLNGLQTVLEHEAIMDAHQPERLLVEAEASRIASEAVHALRQSRRQRRRQDVSVPTWTGRSGAAGAPRRFGQVQRSSESLSNTGLSSSRSSSNQPQSSSSILALLRQRQTGGITVLDDDEPATQHVQSAAVNGYRTVSDFPNLAEEVTSYLNKCAERQASSQSIIDHFGFGRVSGEDVVLFRKMLRSIATFQRGGSSSTNVWVLREEFHD